MKNPRLLSSLMIATTLATFFLSAACAEEAPTTAKFSDPGKPGTLKVILAHGNLRISGGDVTDVSVRSDSKVVNRPRKDGLRTLTSSSSFMLNEKDNVVTLDAMADGWGGGSSDFRVTVPRNTSVVVQSGWGGDIVCTNIAGDIDIKSSNGEIRLDDVAGGVAVETMNGEIRANVRELHADKPLSFTSTNGEVVVRVPPDAKANVRLRTQNGAVLTDFDEQALVTKTETTSRTVSIRRGPKAGRTTALTPEAREALRKSAEAVAQAGREVSDAVRQGFDAARIKADAARARADEDRARADEERARADEERVAPPAPPAAPTPGAVTIPAMPAMPAMPTITGGKLVTGTLNGGGPEISVSTMNGDVTLRKLDAKSVEKK
jgi:hypothetical protein